ncbi:MAG: hypothetical protein ACK5C6_08460 [Roseiflexaceae bacterium]|jgi:hypothetical protein
MIPLFVTMNLLPAGMSRDTPPDWEHSGRAIDAFVNRMCRAGFVPTLFASPEATRAHAPLLEECVDRGCEIGLLVAPSQSTLLNQKKPFGLLPPETQQHVLQHARNLFFDYMGFVPRSVRTGLTSGTPEIFALCKAAGFSHTSIRMPGAQLSTISNVWPTQHHISHEHTVDIPISTNPAERLLNRFPLYLSPEFGTPAQQTEFVARVHTYGYLCSMSSTVIDYYPQDTPVHDNIDAFIEATDAIPALVPMRISQYNPTAPQ